MLTIRFSVLYYNFRRQPTRSCNLQIGIFRLNWGSCSAYKHNLRSLRSQQYDYTHVWASLPVLKYKADFFVLARWCIGFTQRTRDGAKYLLTSRVKSVARIFLDGSEVYILDFQNRQRPEFLRSYMVKIRKIAGPEGGGVRWRPWAEFPF